MKSQINIRASKLLQRHLAELTELLGTSITETISIAIDRMYQQEIQTVTSEPELVYRIPTNEDYYTHNAGDYPLIAGLLDNQEAKIAEWLKRNYPDMPCQIERVPETQSYNHRSKAYSERAEQALESLNAYIEQNWFDWWPAPTE